MSEKIKKIICFLTACAVLTFSCFFCPRQRADAFVHAPVVGTVAGLFALGLLCYGVSTSADSDFVQDNAESWASSNGFFSDPTQSIMNTICSSLFLSSIKLYADLAYSSGACSTTISSTVLPSYIHSIADSSCVSFSLSSSFSFGEKSVIQFNSSGSSDSSVFIVYFGSGTQTLYILSSDKLSSNEFCFYHAGSSYSQTLTTYGTSNSGKSFYYQRFTESAGISYYRASYIYNYLLSLGLPISSYSGSLSDFVDKYVSSPGLEVDTPITAKPVIPGACDVFNSSKSLDSYHVDSPGNDVLDLGNLLDKTDCETIDDVVSKVYTGDLTASDVIGGLDCRPYVDVDVDTGTIAIPGDTTNSRPIALDQDLSIPSDIADTDTYEPLNPPKDDTTTDKPTLPKGAYAFPLADYFPFCLPFDLYKFCNLFVAVPKTPEITLDFSTFLPFFDKENPEQYVYTFDLHSLDRLAEIIRTLELFGIVLGIGLITRRIIGW